MYANEGSTCPSLHTLTTHSHETASDRFFFFLFLSMFFTPMEPLVCPVWGCGCHVKHEFQGQEVDLVHPSHLPVISTH